MLPNYVVTALEDPNFGARLPPISEDAKMLLNLSATEREDPRVIALIAQHDPMYSARLMAYANSAVYAHLDLTTSADAAVRRLGVSSSYALLLACALSTTFEVDTCSKQLRNELLKHAINLTMTARKLVNWCGVNKEMGAVIWLGSLMQITGLFAGLLYRGELSAVFTVGLARQQNMRGSTYLEIEELRGFDALSAAVAKIWKMDERVVMALADLGTRAPQTTPGKLIAAVAELVALASVGTDETPVLQRLYQEGAVTSAVPSSSTVSLGVVLL
jgi:HD-like signal output (HDOD) protein